MKYISFGISVVLTATDRAAHRSGESCRPEPNSLPNGLGSLSNAPGRESSLVRLLCPAQRTELPSTLACSPRLAEQTCSPSPDSTAHTTRQYSPTGPTEQPESTKKHSSDTFPSPYVTTFLSRTFIAPLVVRREGLCSYVQATYGSTS